jgi:hypothetical protein
MIERVNYAEVCFHNSVLNRNTAPAIYAFTTFMNFLFSGSRALLSEGVENGKKWEEPRALDSIVVLTCCRVEDKVNFNLIVVAFCWLNE